MDAERRALTEPDRVARRFTRRIGDTMPLRFGNVAMSAEVVTARFASALLNSVDGQATRVAVAHPAGWGGHRLQSLRAAFAAQGLPDALFLSAPQAAALAHANREQVEIGAAIAVYDLGGGTFDAAVVRRSAADRFELIGRPEEVEIGGLDFDEIVFDHVASTLGTAWTALDSTDPDVLRGLVGLRRECTAAKERLSSDTEVLVRVALPGIVTEVRLGRAEFEEMIRPAVDETVAALDRVLSSAGTAPGALAAVLLIGGSAQIPLIIQEVSARLGRPVSVANDPQGMVAVGAALAARGVAAEPAPIVRPVRTRPPLPTGPALETKRSRRRLAPVVAAGVLVLAVAGALTAAAANIDPAGSITDVTTSTSPTAGPSSVVEASATEPSPDEVDPTTQPEQAQTYTPPASPPATSKRPPATTWTSSTSATPSITTTPTPSSTSKSTTVPTTPSSSKAGRP
ncbi:MAG: Hsp70 family protein [Umezawaea sp.]